MASRFIFLGSGTSQGVLIIGKDYPSKLQANPKKGVNEIVISEPGWVDPLFSFVGIWVGS
jgi:hypothetical protein